MATAYDDFSSPVGEDDPYASFSSPAQAAPTQKRKPSLGLQAGMADAGLAAASGAVAPVVAGWAGTIAGAMGADDPAGVVRNWQSALTYEPHTAEGDVVAKVGGYLPQKLAQGADYAGGKVAQGGAALGFPKTGAAVGAGVNAGIQFIPALLTKKVLGGGEAAATPAAAEAAASEWVGANTSLDWSRLSQALKSGLTEVAKNSGDLSKLDPAAIERQARLTSLNIPATRGQLTRDPVQLRNEANVSATDAGKPIRDIYVAQNKAILDNLQAIKGQTGATATTAEEVGSAVQKAARAKLKYQKRQTSKLYQAADAANETSQIVDTTPLHDLVAKTPDNTQFGWAQSWLNKVGSEPGAGMSIRDLESLRQAATARMKDGGTTAHYAGQLRDAIDTATEGAGGKLYQAARAARKAQGTEFEEQAGVARLVDNKSRTDPAVALEDTWRRTVIGGSNADLLKVRKSLTEGGTVATQRLGRKAWAEMQGSTVNHIIETATKSVARFEDGTPNLTAAALKKGIDQVGKAKIDIQFGPGTYGRLQRILDATVDVKTKPPSMIDGSPTVANALSMLEKMAKVPGGHYVAGAMKAVGKVREMGASTRTIAEAKTDPVAALAARSRTNRLHQAEAENALYTGAAGLPESNKRK